MQAHPLLNQSVLVVGLGASGLAMARWCHRVGAQVTVVDTRVHPPMRDRLASELPSVPCITAPLQATLLEGKGKGSAIRAVFISPGLRPSEVTALVDAARAAGLWVSGELGLWSQALHHLNTTVAYRPTVLAITGTNGKTTVTALTTRLIERAGKSVVMAGNIGPTLLDTLTVALDTSQTQGEVESINSAELPQVWVLELSSFQLHNTPEFEPTVGVVLNISQDHLDWHANMQDYAACKARVFGQQGLRLLNRQDPAVMAMAPLAPMAVSKKVSKTASTKAHQSDLLRKPKPLPAVTFGTDMPQRPGDYGLEEVNGMVWLVRALETDSLHKVGRHSTEEPLHLQRFMPADALRIRGRHNASNALAALALCNAAGCTLAPLLYGLREYTGEPHRVQSIGVINGVEYFDDSKGTNVGATVAAVEGLGADRKVVVILGGDGKAQDFSPLSVPLARYARGIVFIGRDAGVIRAELAAAIQQAGIAVADAHSMEAAIAHANSIAHSGDAVLMSPACASFDMFDNYVHRAEVFCAGVAALALEQGQSLEQHATGESLA